MVAVHCTTDLLASSKIHQVELSTEFFLRLDVLLFDVDQEDAVGP